MPRPFPAPTIAPQRLEEPQQLRPLQPIQKMFYLNYTVYNLLNVKV